jgi:hypothetical protein
MPLLIQTSVLNKDSSGADLNTTSPRLESSMSITIRIRSSLSWCAPAKFSMWLKTLGSMCSEPRNQMRSMGMYNTPVFIHIVDHTSELHRLNTTLLLSETCNVTILSLWRKWVGADKLVEKHRLSTQVSSCTQLVVGTRYPVAVVRLRREKRSFRHIFNQNHLCRLMETSSMITYHTSFLSPYIGECFKL